MGLVEIESVRGTRDASEVGEYTPDVQSWIGLHRTASRNGNSPSHLRNATACWCDR